MLPAFAAQEKGEQEARAEGRVLSVDDRKVSVSLGRKDGVEKGHELEVFSRPEYVRAPGSDKGLYVAEKQIARLVAVEVQEDRCFCTLSEGSDVEVGLRVVLTGGRTGTRKFTPPNIEETVDLQPSNEAACGEKIQIRLRVSDLDNDLSHLEWTASGGRMARAVTLDSENTWVAPSRGGEYEVKVVAVDRRGLRSPRTIEVRSSGRESTDDVLALAVEATLGGGSRHFGRVSDLHFEPGGDVWILDDNIRRVIRLRADFVPVWVSGEHGRDMHLTRLASASDRLFLVDGVTRRVRRYEPGPEMFSGEAEVQFGGRDVLWKPACIRADATGRLWVADPGTSSVKVFDGQGTLLATLGERRDSTALFKEPVAVDFAPDGTAWVLDRARKVLLQFQNFVYAGEREISIREDLVDFRVQPLTGALLVLSSTHLYRVGRRTERLGSESPLKDPRLLSVDTAGRCYVVTQDGRFIVRLTREGRSAGYWGDDDLEGAHGAAVSADGEAALWSDDTVWWLDADGWIRRRVHLPEEETVGRCFIGKRLWVLGQGTGNVYLYEETGAGKSAFTTPAGSATELSKVAFAGGELAVMDPSGTKVECFDAEGKRLRTVTLRAPAGPNGRLAAGADGALCVLQENLVRVLDETGADRVSAAPAREPVRSVASDDGDLFFYADDDGGLWYFSRSQGRRVRVRMSRNSLQATSVFLDDYRRVHVFDRYTGRLVRMELQVGE